MRRRIVALVAGMITLVVLAFAVPLALVIRHNVYNDATRSLQDEANQIANYLHGYTTPSNTQIETFLKTLSSDRAASVQATDGTMIGKAPPGGAAALPALGGFQPGDGDHDNGGPPRPNLVTYHHGKLAQQLVVLNPGGGNVVVVNVYASDDQLHSGETGWWLLLAGSSLGLLLIGIGLAELMGRRLVRPLVRTAETAQQLAVGETGARAPTDGPPEIAEVGRSLNRLADRIDELIAEERETVADLSHRLRTPLTTLRLDAEALRDPVEAERIGGRVVELERMLTAVIHAARRPQREGRMPSSDAREVVGDRIEFWSALTEEQGRHCDVTLPTEPLPVRAGAEDLATAVDALLENVIAHTPEGTDFSVGLFATEDGARLEIGDAGPGIPEDADVRGRSDRGSSGLGLDIARRCAESSGGSMTIGVSSAGGALVTLVLRRP
jgi:signal transduction histidine kinase